MAATCAAIGNPAVATRVSPHRRGVRSLRRAVPTTTNPRSSSRSLRVSALAFDVGGSSKMKVAVTGAGGRTGGLVMKLLSESPDAFAPPRGLVRSSKSADKVKSLVGDDADVVEGDISDPAALAKLVEVVIRGRQAGDNINSVEAYNVDDCKPLVVGPVDALVILTSAVPKPKLWSMVQALVSKVLPWMENRRPEFYFPDDGTPEKVDWLWQKTQIDAATAAGVKKIVLVSSMGGTQLDNFLNTMGGGGSPGQANILLWKRKAEMYLVASGVDYTVVHPGGLLNKDGGKRELLVGMDDELLKRDRRSVPRADVAAVVVRCLDAKETSNLSFDLASRDEGEGAGPTKDVVGLVGTLKGRAYDYAKPENSPVPLP